ncbi:hypothetical protein GDO81_013913 [Engystomops pustulosus]|uniref:Uncharacterized protein n=1 Tax=Engystomops pustulosus TaxID=76066 RepID=A0AAV7B6P7_ENGPU|nr:hypothetical protein GDO81_013913 [Engystomops pustulosus]
MDDDILTAGGLDNITIIHGEWDIASLSLGMTGKCSTEVWRRIGNNGTLTLRGGVKGTMSFDRKNNGAVTIKEWGNDTVEQDGDIISLGIKDIDTLTYEVQRTITH